MTKKEFAKALGANIRRIREKKGLSQDAVILEAGFSRATMSRIESGQVDAQAWTLKRISKAMKVKLRDLFDF